MLAWKAPSPGFSDEKLQACSSRVSPERRESRFMCAACCRESMLQLTFRAKRWYGHSLLKLPLVGGLSLKFLFFQNKAFSKVLFGFAFPALSPHSTDFKPSRGLAAFRIWSSLHRPERPRSLCKSKETACTCRSAQHAFQRVGYTYVSSDALGRGLGAGAGKICCSAINGPV